MIAVASEFDFSARIGRMQQADADKRRLKAEAREAAAEFNRSVLPVEDLARICALRDAFEVQPLLIETERHLLHRAFGPVAVEKAGVLDGRVWQAINRTFAQKYCSWWEKRVDGVDLEIGQRALYVAELRRVAASPADVIRALRVVKREFYCVPSPADFAKFVVGGGWRKYQVGGHRSGVAACRS